MNHEDEYSSHVQALEYSHLRCITFYEMSCVGVSINHFPDVEERVLQVLIWQRQIFGWNIIKIHLTLPNDVKGV